MKRDGLIKVGGIRCKGWWIDVQILKTLKTLTMFIWMLYIQLKMLSIQLKMLSEEEFKALITCCTYEQSVYAFLLRYCV